MPFTIRFLPDNVSVDAAGEENLVVLAAYAGITLRGACGGTGACGRCRVLLRQGRVMCSGEVVVAPEEVLACRSRPLSDVTIEVPETSRLYAHRVLIGERDGDRVEEQNGPDDREWDPLYREVRLAMTPPEVDDAVDDLERLRAAVAKEIGVQNLHVGLDVVRELPQTLRAADWQVTAAVADAGEFMELSEVRAGHGGPGALGLAVDIGTTTVACRLVDLATGKAVASAGTYNRQAAYGDDVISRIIFATEEPRGLALLQHEVTATINGLLVEMLEGLQMAPGAVRVVSCAGNPTMTHLFLGVNPRFLRLEPYVPAVNSWSPVRAADIGLNVHPRAWVHCMPGVASYLGGDITAGLVVAGVDKSEKVTLFVDIGTNGEMILGNREWLMGCACSAGPAFEGGGITCGMRAMSGAIERVGITPGGYEVVWQTIEDAPPVGICGSGLINILAALHEAGVIDRTGHFSGDLDTPRLRTGREGKEFVLVWAGQSGCQQDIVLTEGDLENILRAKAAVFAGLRTMLAAVGLETNAIECVLIAGGFGRHLNVHDVVAIGMLPDLPPERFTYLGNTSLKGACAALLSRAVRDRIDEVARSITYVDLSKGNDFMDEFISALFIPHTDLRLFPSVVQKTR